MFVSPGAIAVQTDFFTIHWYGIIMACAFVIAQALAIMFAKKFYDDKSVVDNLYEMAFWVLLGGIIGARLYYVVLSFDFYLSNPLEAIMLQHGGLSIHGALLGGILATLIYTLKNKLNFFLYTDLYALALPIGQAIGRWGNFFNSEAFGIPTKLPWGVFIPEELRPFEYKTSEFFHPAFLYESLMSIFIFLILYFIIRKFWFKKKGIITCSYFLLYSTGRIFIENIRTDSVLNIAGVPVAIHASYAIIIAFICVLYVLTEQKSE